MFIAGAVAVCLGDSALDSSLRKIMRAPVWAERSVIVSPRPVDNVVICLVWRIKKGGADGFRRRAHSHAQTDRYRDRQTDRGSRQWGFKSRLISSAFLSLLEFLGGLVALSGLLLSGPLQ